MKRTEYTDQFGTKWFDIIYRRGSDRLKELKQMYEQDGNRCWLFPFNDNKDMLSVMVKPS